MLSKRQYCYIIKDSFSAMHFKTKKDGLTMIVNNGFMVDVKDESMQPLIPKNSKVKLSIQETYENGDIVYINVGGNYKIRGIYHFELDLFLYAYNKEYNNELVKFGDYTIIGKVSSCMFDL